MSQVQRFLHTLIDIGEATQPPADGVWVKYNRAFQDLYAAIKGGEMPIVVGLGHRDGHRQICESWSFLPDGGQIKVPTGDREPVWMLQNETGTLSLQTCEPNYRRPPFEFVEYSHSGDRRWSCELPQRPPIGTKMGIREPVVSKYATYDNLEIVAYSNDGTGIMAYDNRLREDADDPDAYAVLSVNIVEQPLNPGYFWLKTWSETEALAKSMVDAGVVMLTGRRCENGYVNAVEAYLNYRKLNDVPFIVPKEETVGNRHQQSVE